MNNNTLNQVEYNGLTIHRQLAGDHGQVLDWPTWLIIHDNKTTYFNHLFWIWFLDYIVLQHLVWHLISWGHMKRRSIETRNVQFVQQQGWMVKDHHALVHLCCNDDELWAKHNKEWVSECELYFIYHSPCQNVRKWALQGRKWWPLLAS